MQDQQSHTTYTNKNKDVTDIFISSSIPKKSLYEGDERKSKIQLRNNLLLYVLLQLQQGVKEARIKAKPQQIKIPQKKERIKVDMFCFTNKDNIPEAFCLNAQELEQKHPFNKIEKECIVTHMNHTLNKTWQLIIDKQKLATTKQNKLVYSVEIVAINKDGIFGTKFTTKKTVISE